MKRKKIAIVGTNGLPGRYGGWDQLMHHLVTHLGEKNKFSVYTSSYDSDPNTKTYHGADLPIIRLRANGVQSIPYDIISLILATIRQSDAILVCGISGGLFFPVMRFFKPKVVLNPDGAEWKRAKFGYFTKKYLKLSEKIAVKYADMVVADNKLIQEEIFRAYGVKSYLIEYGGDNVKKVKLSTNTATRYGIASDSYAFKVCRIVPENNIDLILEVFSRRSMNLVLVGNWAFSNYGLALKEKYKGYDNLILLDPIYEQSAIDELRSNCSLYIHGHSAGGTNPSLVEAMNLGLCCVVYNASYNIETTENKALYFNTEADLNGIVEDYENNSLDVKSVKETLYEVALRRYSWSLITDKYGKVFMEATKS